MQKELRLRTRNEFQQVFRRGRSFAHPLLVLRAYPTSRPLTRYGFVVGKTLGNAVRRNYVRRILREAARQSPVVNGWDIVLIARPALAHTPFCEMKETLQLLLHRARLVSVEQNSQTAG